MKKRKKKTRIIVTGVLAGFVLFFLAVNIYFMQCAEKENERKNVLEEEKVIAVCGAMAKRGVLVGRTNRSFVGRILFL